MTWSGFLKLGSSLRFWAWNSCRSADPVPIQLGCSILSPSRLVLTVPPLPLCISIVWHCVVAQFNSAERSVESSSATTPGTVGDAACVGLDVTFTDLTTSQRGTENRTKNIIPAQWLPFNQNMWLLLISELKLLVFLQQIFSPELSVFKGIVGMQKEMFCSRYTSPYNESGGGPKMSRSWKAIKVAHTEVTW